MDPLQKPQICPLRVPNEREHRRFVRGSRWSHGINALVPLILLLPILGTPSDPQVPRFIVMLIGMELVILLLYHFGEGQHRSSAIYFDAHCTRCYARLTWRLGSSRYGLDRKGAFRCRCRAAHVYEKRMPAEVVVTVPPPNGRWFSSVGTLLPRAWPAD